MTNPPNYDDNVDQGDTRPTQVVDHYPNEDESIERVSIEPRETVVNPSNDNGEESIDQEGADPAQMVDYPPQDEESIDQEGADPAQMVDHPPQDEGSISQEGADLAQMVNHPPQDEGSISQEGADPALKVADLPHEEENIDRGSTQPTRVSDDHPIWVKELGKKFLDQVVVDKVSFYVPHGTVFGFIGPSGSGKTTTVRMLTGIYHPTSGEAHVLGRKPGKFSRHDREKIGYMPQQFVLYPDLSVWENLRFAASVYGVGAGRSKRMKELLEFVELGEHRHKRVSQISGGMQRRLSLAATLVHEPELLFLDEPTTGLDPVLRKKFWEHFHDLKEQGITIFVTTQYVSDAAYCDLVGMMVDGKLVALDTPVGLRRKALGGDVVVMRTVDRIDYGRLQALATLPFVKRADRAGENEARITVDDSASAIPELVEWSGDKNIEVESIQEFLPPFDDVFVALIHQEKQSA